eukprot:gene3031-13056_t
MRLTTLHKTVAHEEGVWSASWIPGSNKILSGSVDESVKIWEDGQDGLQFLHTNQGHTLGVISAAVDSRGEYAAVSALDSVIRVWNLNDHSTMALIEAVTTETWAVDFMPRTGDQIMLASAGGSRGAVLIWDLGSESPVVQSELFLPAAPEDKQKKERFVLSVAYSPDGKRLACGAMDGTVAVFDVETGALLKDAGLQGHHKPVRSLAFTPDSRSLLTACDDMHVNMYDVDNSSLIESFSGHESWVLSVHCHPNGNAFVSGGSDSKVKLWDFGTRTCVQTLADHNDQVWSVAFSGDGNRVVSASDDKQLITYGFA